MERAMSYLTGSFPRTPARRAPGMGDYSDIINTMMDVAANVDWAQVAATGGKMVDGGMSALDEKKKKEEAAKMLQAAADANASRVSGTKSSSNTWYLIAAAAAGIYFYNRR